MNRTKLNNQRRDILRFMAKSGVLIPFFYNFMGQKVFAATGVERAIFVYYPNGVQHDTAANGLVYHPRSAAGTTGSSIDLTNTCLQAFAGVNYDGTTYDLRNDMVFLRNLELHGQNDSHANGAAAIWSCNDSGASTTLNCEIARRRQQASQLSTEHLFLGVRNPGSGGDLSTAMSRRDGVDKLSEVNPYSALEMLQGYAGSSSAAADDTTSDAQSATKLKVLEIVEKDLANLENLALSTTEKAKLDAHRLEFDELKRRLSTGPVSCSNIHAMQLRSDASQGFTGQMLQWDKILDDQIDLAVSALACGMTNVVTLKYCEHTSEVGHKETTDLYPVLHNLSVAAGQPDYNEYMLDHASSHVRADAHLEMSKWFNTHMAYMIAQLKARNLLDSTVVVALSENADGSEHDNRDGGWWVAGGSNAINTGQVLDVNGARHSSLLVDIARAMGTGITGWGTSEGSISGFLK